MSRLNATLAARVRGVGLSLECVLYPERSMGLSANFGGELKWPETLDLSQS